jgi:hypothetical protein
MIIPGQFGFNCQSGFREEAFWNIFPIVSNKMSATAIHRLTLDPMGKCSNAFFSDNTNMIKAKLYMNDHWKVLYKVYVFYASWIFDRHKQHNVCRGPSNDHSCAVWFQLSKWFQRRSILKKHSHRVQC